MGDLIILVGRCDLYFMVQGFCLISSTISELIVLIGQCDLNFMVQ